MKTVNATQAKQYFGELLNNAQQEPVAIQKYQKDFAILLSSASYQELLAFEDCTGGPITGCSMNTTFMWMKPWQEWPRDLVILNEKLDDYIDR